MTLLKDLKPGDNFNGSLFVKFMEPRNTSTGSPYVHFILSDQSESIISVVWDTPHEGLEDFQGKVVNVFGQIRDYKGKKQLSIKDIQNITIDPTKSIEDFIPSAPVKETVLNNLLKTQIDSIQDPELKAIVTYIYNKPEMEVFSKMPAAKVMHHAFYSGLIYHTTRMIAAAKALIPMYPSIINEDIVTAAILLHDAGKVVELKSPTDYEYTTYGSLIGHITIDILWVQEAVNALGYDMNSEKVMLLTHAILAHHGELEYGSPVAPKTPEAILIHHIDTLDAKLAMVEEVFAKTEAGEFTEPVFGLNNNKIYKDTLK